MNRHTPPSWAAYRESIGDRSGLFAAVASAWAIDRALYPGCYLDLSPSTAIPDVTYLDVDKRAARYFADVSQANAELDGRCEGTTPRFSFLHMDYTGALPIDPGSMDLLISLYAGPVWDHCREYLAHEGLLLANTSHGDASIAALDPELKLVAAVHHDNSRYRLATAHLDRYLVPKSAVPPDAARIRGTGRGVAYTRSAFAYVFQAR